MATDEIVYCDGKYEVHPMHNSSSWSVVNSETGDVRCTFADKEEAVELATELNAEAE